MARAALRPQGGFTDITLHCDITFACVIEGEAVSVHLQAPYSQHSHHKSQTFTMQKGYAVEQPCIVAEADVPPSIQETFRDGILSEQRDSSQKAQHSTSMSRTPKWIENDGKASSMYHLTGPDLSLLVFHQGLCPSLAAQRSFLGLRHCMRRYCVGMGTSRKQCRSRQERLTGSEG